MQKKIVTVLAFAVVLAGCSPMSSAPPAAALNDGQLPLPADYRIWPKFLTDVQRADIRQIRDIYMNADAARGSADRGFPQGSTFVMENWSVKLDPAGQPLKGADDKLVKDKLAAVFVMGKNTGWGANVPEAQKNGDWIYAAFKGDGEPNGEAKYETCRVCHAPLKDKDFVFRYDEHFARLKADSY
jgi:hemoglobin